MSKNFELMQQADIKLPFPSPSPVAASPAAEVHAAESNGHTRTVRLDLDNLDREECQKLVQSIFLLNGNDTPHVVVFSGIDAGNGCSGICANAAKILASKIRGTVCLVDANRYSPALSHFLGNGNGAGNGFHTSVLGQQPSAAARSSAKVVGPDNLWLISAGFSSTEVSNSTDSNSLRAQCLELRKQFDYVLIDSPPLNTHADGIAIGQLADGLVLVLEANNTRRETAARVAERLQAAEIRVLGAVLNKRTYPIPERLYHVL